MEYKVRVWNGETMIIPDYVKRDGTAFWYENSIPTTSKDLMFWTGLKDKNGVEIYTGDIVKCHDHPTGILDTTGEVKSKHGHYQVNGNPLHDYGTAWTNIIGNIYTNPELLNAK